MKNTSLPLKAFKRFTSLGRSKWYMGILLTNLTETPDTNGAFSLFEATLVSGTEPPPHLHSREDELFYVLEGEFDVYVGQEAFKVRTGECVFLPRFVPHAFVVRSPRLRLLILFAPAGVEEAFRSMSSPAQYLNPPKGALTYSAADLEQTAQRFSASGVRMLAPDEIGGSHVSGLRRGREWAETGRHAESLYSAVRTGPIAACQRVLVANHV